MWPKEPEEPGSSSVWLLFGCVILGKSHNLSRPEFPHLLNEHHDL